MPRCLPLYLSYLGNAEPEIMALLSCLAGVSSSSQTWRAVQVDPGSILEAAWGAEAAGAGDSPALGIAESGCCFLTKRLPALLQSS